MNKKESEQDRIIRLTRERGEFTALEDGYVYFWPQDHGAMSAHNLRTLADELDRINKEWDDQIEREFRLSLDFRDERA